jgi:hypothetical protein
MATIVTRLAERWLTAAYRRVGNTVRYVLERARVLKKGILVPILCVETDVNYRGIAE